MSNKCPWLTGGIEPVFSMNYKRRYVEDPGVTQLRALYIELDAVERIYFRYERVALTRRRGEILGKIKKLEKEKNQ